MYVLFILILLYMLLFNIYITIPPIINVFIFKFQNALSLKSRPPCHATTLIPVICLFLLLIVRLFKLQRLRRLPLILFVAWFSHHIRDATRRGLWLWPWGSTSPLPYWFYITLIAVIPYLVIALMKVTSYWTGPSEDSKHRPSVVGVQHV